MTKREMLLQALGSTVPDLERLVRGVGIAATTWSPAVGEWSALDVLAHLVHVELAYQVRLERVLSEDRPLVPAIEPADYPLTSQDTPAGLMARFTAERGRTLQTLSALKPGAWQRVAVQANKRSITLRFLIQDLVDHDIEHTNQLVMIRAALRKTNAAAAEASGRGGR